MITIRIIIFLFSRNFFTYLDNLIQLFRPLKQSISSPHSILIIRWDRIGDAVAILPLINAIKLKLPNASIDILCSEGNEWIFKNNHQVNKIIRLENVGFTYGISRILKFIYSPFNFKIKKQLENAIGKYQYDLCIDCLGGEHTIHFKKFAKTFIGPKTEDGFSWMYDYYPKKPIRYSEKTVAQYYMDSVNTLLGNENEKIKNIGLIPIKKPIIPQSIIEKLNEPFILVSITGSSSYRSLKEQSLIELIHELSKIQSVMVFDSPKQERIPLIKNKLPSNTIILPKLSLPELAYISKKARLYIGNDGGPSNYCATQCNSLILFNSKSYKYEFQAWVSNIGAPTEVITFNDASLHSNSKNYAALIQKPSIKYPFKPYYIENKPCSISVKSILESVKILRPTYKF